MRDFRRNEPFLTVQQAQDEDLLSSASNHKVRDND